MSQVKSLALLVVFTAVLGIGMTVLALQHPVVINDWIADKAEQVAQPQATLAAATVEDAGSE